MSEDAGFNIDFTALKAQASEMFDQADAAPVAAAPVVDPTPAPVGESEAPTPVEQQTAQQDSIEQSASAALELSDDTLVKVLVDGEEQEIPWKDARGSISGGLKFTKSMQQLAQERKAFEAEAAQLAALRGENDTLRNFLTSPQLLDYAQQRFASATPQQQPGQPNNDEIATIGEARALVEQQTQTVAQQLQQMQQQVEATIAQRERALQDRQETAQHALVIDSTLADIFTKNPVLNAIPNASDLIRYNVAQMLTERSTQKDAIEAFNLVSRGMVDEIGKHFKQTQTAQKIAAAKQKLVSSSIEPSGGSAPQLAPTSFKDANGAVNWNAVRDIARNFQS